MEDRLPKFEECLQRLEVIVKEMERGDLPLEQSLKLFEEGVALSASCRKELEEAEGKIEILLKARWEACGPKHLARAARISKTKRPPQANTRKLFPTATPEGAGCCRTEGEIMPLPTVVIAQNDPAIAQGTSERPSRAFCPGSRGRECSGAAHIAAAPRSAGGSARSGIVEFGRYTPTGSTFLTI